MHFRLGEDPLCGRGDLLTTELDKISCPDCEEIIHMVEEKIEKSEELNSHDQDILDTIMNSVRIDYCRTFER